MDRAASRFLCEQVHVADSTAALIGKAERDWIVKTGIGVELPAERRLMPDVGNQMTCKRCNTELKELGRKRFHEGARFGLFGDLAEMLVKREEFLLCICENCGEISFFVPDYEEKKRAEQIAEEYGDYKKHPRYKEFLRGDAARKFLPSDDQRNSFVQWLESDSRGTSHE